MNKVRKSIHSYLSAIIVVVLALLLFVYPVFAQPTNPDFETGDLTGWTTQGNVEVLQASNLIPNITPPEGQYFVLLSTGFGDGWDGWDGSGHTIYFELRNTSGASCGTSSLFSE